MEMQDGDRQKQEKPLVPSFALLSIKQPPAQS